MSFFEQFMWVKPVVIFFAIMIGVLLAILTFVAWVNRGERIQKKVIQEFEFTSEVIVGVKDRYPHLTDDDVKLALQQLRLYFLIFWQGDRNEVIMPSRLVDECWHFFILQTRSYQAFCNQAFGGFLHHAPKRLDSGSSPSEMTAPNEPQKINLKDGAKVFQAALAMTDITTSAGHTPRTSIRVPMLFAIDKMLKIQDGHMYSDEALQLLAAFDWRTSRLTDRGSQSSSEGSSASLGCGDGSIDCGSCAGGD